MTDNVTGWMRTSLGVCFYSNTKPEGLFVFGISFHPPLHIWSLQMLVECVNCHSRTPSKTLGFSSSLAIYFVSCKAIRSQTEHLPSLTQVVLHAVRAVGQIQLCRMIHQPYIILLD